MRKKTQWELKKIANRKTFRQKSLCVKSACCDARGSEARRGRVCAHAALRRDRAEIVCSDDWPVLEKAAETLANRRSTRASKGSGRRSSCGSACARPPWRRRWRRSRPSIPWRRSGRGRRGSCPGLRVPGIKNIQIFKKFARI